MQDKIVKLQRYELNIFIGQNNLPMMKLNNSYLTIQPLYYTLKRTSNTETVVLSKSKGLSAKKLTIPYTTDNSISPSIK